MSGNGEARPEAYTDFDVVIIGAGLAGLYALWKCRALGFRTRVLEAGPAVGGTWYWNRYPGLRCDVESMQYSYSFLSELEQTWSWSEKYAAQPEILAYINHVAKSLDLARDIQFDSRVSDAIFDADRNGWDIRVVGQPLALRAKFCLMATGCLSVPKPVDLAGASEFGGQVLHTTNWPNEMVSLDQKRVGVVGTGSSGIQLIPVVARQCAHLTVFQRTPNYSVPARNLPMTASYEERWKSSYPTLRELAANQPTNILHTDAEAKVIASGLLSALEATPEELEAELEYRWSTGGLAILSSFSDIRRNERANAVVSEFLREKIKTTVKDPETARKLLPTFPVGSRRLCLDTDYYATYNRSNVSLVDLRSEPIKSIVPRGIETTSRAYELDTIIMATGYDAMTGALNKMRIVGQMGQELRDSWKDGPVSYLGLAVAGFPNLFLITGPTSPSVLTNMIASIEHHVEWIVQLLTHLKETKVSSANPKPEAQADWMRHVRGEAEKVLAFDANSWQAGGNIKGKPRAVMTYPSGVPAYRKICASVAHNRYEGFDLK